MPSSHRAQPPPEEQPGRTARRWAALLPVLFAVLAVALIAAGVIPLRVHHSGSGRGDTGATGPTALAPGASPTPAPTGPAPTPTVVVTTAVSGLITVTSPKNSWTYPGICAGTGKYDDLAAGAAVTVFDDQNQQVATTVLRAGVAGSRKVCSFSFDVTPIALARPSYTVQIGGIVLRESLAGLVKGKYVFQFHLSL